MVSPSPPSIRATGACSRRTAPCAAASRRWATLPADGSARPASAWNSPTWPSSEPPRGPAAHDLRPVERLERHALGGHRPRVLADVDRDARRGHPRPDVQAAGPEHHLQPALALDLGPRLVGARGQPHVVAPVVGAADDPAHVLGRAVEVADLVPLEAQDAGPGPARRPVGGRRPERPEADDHDVPVAAHRSLATRPVLAQALSDVAADVEAHVLHRRVPPELEAARRHPGLDALADRPVLAVDEVPELDGVRRVEGRLGDLVGMEQEVDHDEGAVRPLGEQRERRGVVGRQAEHQVGVRQLALVADLLVVVEAGERRAIRAAGHGERERALGLGHAVVPVEVAAALLLERRHDAAQLRVHARAVVALVVVLDDDLPVGADVVDDPAGGPQVRERVARDAPGDPAQLGRQRVPGLHPLGRQVHEQPAAPGVDRDRVQAELGGLEAVRLAEERRVADAAVELVAPRVVRAADDALEAARRARGVAGGRVVALVRGGQPRAAMAADVVVGADVARAVAHDDDLLAGHVHRQEVARLRELLDPADDDPLGPPDPLALPVEERLVDVGRPRQRRLERVARGVAGRAVQGRTSSMATARRWVVTPYVSPVSGSVRGTTTRRCSPEGSASRRASGRPSR